MNKDIYKGEINDQGIELVPDWTALGINPITGFAKGREFDSKKQWYKKGDKIEKRREYMREYQKKLRRNK